MNQHPLESCAATDRFIVMLEVGSKSGRPIFEPLSYGMDGQPSPSILLRRGARAAGFLTEDAARAALRASAHVWEAAGYTFHHRKQVQFVKVEMAK